MRRHMTVATATAVALLFSPGVAAAAPGTDFGIAMQGPATATTGEAFSYAISISNTGRSKSATTMTDSLPAQLTVQDVVTTGATCSTTGNDVSCTTAKLAPGESAAVSITVVAVEAGSITNNATLADDADPNNNNASVVTDVARAAEPLGPQTATAPYDHAGEYRYGYADRETGGIGVHVAGTCMAVFETLISNYCSGEGYVQEYFRLNGTGVRPVTVTVTFDLTRAAVTGDDPTALVDLGLSIWTQNRFVVCKERLLGPLVGHDEVVGTTVTVTCPFQDTLGGTSIRVGPFAYGERTLDDVTVDVDAVVSSITVSA